MYLKTIALRNFRSFDAGEVELQKDLTVFVGENNGGKSNAIDAIRLITQPLGGRREIYCEPTDVRFQSPTKGFELEATFSDLSVGQYKRTVADTSGRWRTPGSDSCDTSRTSAIGRRVRSMASAPQSGPSEPPLWVETRHRRGQCATAVGRWVLSCLPTLSIRVRAAAFMPMTSTWAPWRQ